MPQIGYLSAVGSEATIPFYGRRKELAFLTSWLEGKEEANRTKSLLVVGPGGIGKSRLLGEFCLRQKDIPHALFQTNFSGRGEPFHAPYRRLLEQIFATQQLADVPISLTQTHARNDEFWKTIQLERVEGVMDLVCSQFSAQQPMLLLIEDLHFASSSALRIIRDLMNKFQDHPVWFLCTSRITHEFLPKTVELPPLAKEEAELILVKVAGEGSAVLKDTAAILERCNGNPFYLQEVTRAMLEGGSEKNVITGNLQHHLVESIRMLTPEAKELAERASVFGSLISVKSLAEFSARTSGNIVQTLQPLQIFSFVEDDTKLQFRHDLLRDSVYESIPEPTRQKWHAELGALLEAADAFPEEMAEHFGKGRDQVQALRYSLLGARRLSQLPKSDEALALAEQAEVLARVTEDEPSLMEALEIQFDIRSQPVSLQDGLKMLDKFKKERFPANDQALARMRFLQSQFLYKRGEFKRAERELGRIRSGQDMDRFFRRELMKGRILARTGKHRDAVHRGMEILHSPKLPVALKPEFLMLLGYVSYLDSEISQAEDFYEQAFSHCVKERNTNLAQKAAGNLGNTAYVRGDPMKARHYYLEFAKLAVESGDLVGHAEILLRLGGINFDLLATESALKDYERAEQVFERLRVTRSFHQSRLMRASALRHLGEFSTALRLANSAMLFFEEKDMPYALTQAVRTMAMIMRDDGQLKEALQFLNQKFFQRKAYPNQARLGHLLKIDLLIRLRRHEEAKVHMNRFLEENRLSQCTYAVRIEALRLQFRLSREKDPKLLEEIGQVLTETEDRGMPFQRLPLFAEVLLTHDDPKWKATAMELMERIRSAFPMENRRFFDSLHHVRKLKNLAKGTGRKDQVVDP